MEIVVTDGFTVNPGDLAWDEIAAFGHLVLFDRTSESEIIDRCRGANIILTNKVPFNCRTIDALPSLQLISVMATGFNVVDTAYARSRQIPVCSVPVYGTYSVAQHSIALMLELSNQVGLHAASVRQGEWKAPQDWSYAKTELTEWKGKKLGIVGYGAIGRQTARIAAALGMEILYTGPRPHHGAEALFLSREELFAQADVVSLHCPLTPENVEMVNSRLLNAMKPTAFLINTARGQLINEEALAEALNSGRLAGAALDVLAKEPPEQNNPLLQARHCLITPHNAWKSKAARERIITITASNIRCFLNGHPQHVVN